MDAKKLNQLLINNFPDLEEKYHAEVDWQEGEETGSHVLFLTKLFWIITDMNRREDVFRIIHDCAK